MVFQWCLSDTKSPQVSRTLLSILADLNNAVVWMFPIRSLISKSFSSSTNPLVAVPRAPITIGITVTFKSHSFSFPKQGPGTYPSFRFLSIFLWGQPGQQSPPFGKFSGQIRWSVFISKSKKEFVCLLLLDRFWVVHLPLVKLHFLAQFPKDHFAHVVVSSLIFFLY